MDARVVVMVKGCRSGLGARGGLVRPDEWWKQYSEGWVLQEQGQGSWRRSSEMEMTLQTAIQGVGLDGQQGQNTGGSNNTRPTEGRQKEERTL